MLTTTQAKEYAELSQAAYAYFDEGDFLGRGGTDRTVMAKLGVAGKGDFTVGDHGEALDLTSRYTLLHQYRENPDSNGFSASVFQQGRRTRMASRPGLARK